jgi:hypothetical protein
MGAARRMVPTRMPLVRRRWFALLALLLVALPLGAAGRDQYFCRMMGRLMDSCCCVPPGADTSHVARSSGGPRLERQDCCERVEGLRASATALRDAAVRLPLSAFATLACARPLLPELPSMGSVQGEAVQARAPPPTGPPLYLKHCALLS